MSKTTYTIIFLAVLFTSCAFLPSDIPKYERIANRLKVKVGKTLSKKYDMEFVGSGGQLMHQVNVLFLAFDIKKPLTKKNARNLLIECVEYFVNTINKNEKIRPFLKNYPANEENVEISIHSSDENGKVQLYPLIAVISLRSGEVVFRTEEKGQKFGYKTVERESYEEALKIVQEDKGE